jgi:cytochrome c peroxidase
MTRLRRIGLFALIAAVLCASRALQAASPGVPALPTTTDDYVKYAVTDLPNHFKNQPLAGRNNTPVDNPITNAGATLGRVLFYDDRLSHNDGLSCSSCHKQENDFSDPATKSLGFEGGLTGRHSMGLSNGAYYDRGTFFWNERASSLENQVLMPIQDPVEMGTNLTQLTAELAATTFYPTLFQNAFGTPEVTSDRISKSLAQFVRSMVTYQSKFDAAVAAGPPGAPNYTAAGYTPQEIDGAGLFHGVGRCNLCHTTAAQVGDLPHNIGLDADNSADVGVSPPGAGQFKTPSLRNSEVRDGYMHDGRFTSLEQVVEFYSTGIQNNPTLDPILKPGGQPLHLNFTTAQKAALVAFLKTLTDQSFLTNEIFSDPFVQLAGDFDDNGAVDGNDLVVWKEAFGSTNAADADGDGDSDGQDYLAWQRNFGLTWEDMATSVAATAAVPEPSAAAILSIAGVALATFHRRRRA